MLLLDIKKTLMSCLNIRIGIDVLPDAIARYYLTQIFNEKKIKLIISNICLFLQFSEPPCLVFGPSENTGLHFPRK